MKSAVEQEGLDTFRAVKRGESRLSLTIARKVMKQFRGFDACAATARSCAATIDVPLTAKEERVLQLNAEGKSNRQVGAAVFLADGTVKSYVSRILEKLHARSRTGLTVCAVGRRS
ncbi:response regulator transcription factor [Hydrogenophaga sp.]|jgi:DNA-binding NarL/FixJ family response regulator|uniref:response regulator transcription factor n=1 Tax=Hydrogenophaga sp. TaxID=1904254 RepID=UPI0015F4019D|nr:LuxR C-terminal-related transcriptional regulator [Hydrogenophaga sp.]MDZ4398180.1 LuxR C-terminal-related transcriptional regulator [Hydrogenophaga sp.]